MIYPTLMGYSDRCPVKLPPVDHAALMRDAHQIARSFRPLFQTYRQAMVYGLSTAWKSVLVRREFQSLNAQAGTPATPHTAAQIAASRRATRRCGASLWAS